MKFIYLILINIIIFPFLAKAQLSDTAIIKRLSINGFCLCKTTVESLKQSSNDLKEVEVEEMNLANGCLGQDSRFIAGKGYASDTKPGLIFQKDQEFEYISKIRLTKQFKGNLPDGTYIDLSKLLLKDLFKLFPVFKDKWRSRGCSDYWQFSNDTITFFVKIDKIKTPQFPIDRAYYEEKHVEAVDLISSCYNFKSDKVGLTIQDDSKDPVFFIDSVRVNKIALQDVDPKQIAIVKVYKNSEATERLESATHGLIYIETKKFAKERYWKYFKSKSARYAEIVPFFESDLNIQYILNNKILTENFEGDLAAINNKMFKRIQIINKQQLINTYHITNKEYGVLINSDIPPNLYHRK